MAKRKLKLDDTRRGKLPGVCVETLASYQRRLALLTARLNRALRKGDRATVASVRSKLAVLREQEDLFLRRAVWGER